MPQNELNRLKSPLSALVARMLTTLMATSVVSLIVDLVLSTILPETWNRLLLITPPLTIVACCLLYGDAWRMGERDHNLVKFGHIQYDRYKSLKAGIIVMAPGFCFALMSWLLTGHPNERVDAVGLIFEFLYTCLYTQFYWLEFLVQGQAFVRFIPVLITPVASIVGYSLGYKGVYIRTFVLYNRKEAEKVGKRPDKRRR